MLSYSSFRHHHLGITEEPILVLVEPDRRREQALEEEIEEIGALLDVLSVEIATHQVAAECVV
jgi:hypothetical protein